MEEIKPLTMEALMIQDDSSRPHPQACSCSSSPSPLALLLTKPFLFPLKFPFLALFFKWEENEENVVL